MRIDVFTLFPNLVDAFCSESLLGRARNEKIVDLRCHDLREHTTDVHHSVTTRRSAAAQAWCCRPSPCLPR